MKKLLALTLALALTLSLAAPALAEEADEYAAYEAAHPEEVAGLDVDELLAGWGYKDISKTAGEQFMDAYGVEGESLEDAVRELYIAKRITVEQHCVVAESYREMEGYAEEWGSFDPDAFCEKVIVGKYGWTSKEEYVQDSCILNEAEFADDMFVWYISELDEDTYDILPGDWWEDDDLSDGEPTLTLYVDGFAHEEVELTAADGVTYADAAALRGILGERFVPAGETGPLPVRSTAQAAGWDVQWYDGGWRGVDQEVQLWNRAKYETELVDQFGPLNGFLAKAMKQSAAVLFSETPISGRETVDVELTRFSTLDEDRKYTLTLGVDYVVQKGVVDMTLTFDVSQLLALVDPRDLAGWAREGSFTPAQLTALLKAGTAELILDYSQGAMAYNIPLLALFDPDLAGWHTETLPGDWTEMEKALEEPTLVNTLYASMTTTAGYNGAEYAAENYKKTVAALTLFCGKDRFSTQNGRTTYSLTTQGMNRAVGELIAQAAGLEEVPQVSVFKHCELTYTLDDNGGASVEMRLRPDVAGIASAMAEAMTAQDDYGYTYGMATLMGWYLPALDMDITASGGGDRGRSTSSLDVHWNNVGTMSLRAAATSGTALSGPRQIEDL